MPHIESLCQFDPYSRTLGELRIKLDPSCAEEMEHVVLKLELKEFSEVKYLWVPMKRYSAVPLNNYLMHSKPDAMLPEYPCPSNASHYDSLLISDPFGFSLKGEYNEALSDPERWVVGAEERVAWSSSQDLFPESFGEPFLYLECKNICAYLSILSFNQTTLRLPFIRLR